MLEEKHAILALMLAKILYWTLLFFLIRNIWRVVRATKIITSIGKVPKGHGPFNSASKDKGSPIEAEYTVVNEDKKS